MTGEVPRDENGRFLKGHSGNPEGVNRADREVQALISTAKRHWLRDIHELTELTLPELQELINDPKTPIRRAMIAAMINRVITKGDAHSSDPIVKRILGDYPKKIEIEGMVGTSQLPKHDLFKLLSDPKKRKALDILGFDGEDGYGSEDESCS